MTSTDLSQKMIARADKDNLPQDHELRTKAKSFDEATLSFYKEPPDITVKHFMGAWAGARLAWFGYSGEWLV